LAYYLFKMFFEEQMQDKVRVSEMQRQRDYRFREQQFSYDQRRAEMELRMQEMALEKELLWMQQNPGKSPSHAPPPPQSGLGIETNSSHPIPFGMEGMPMSMGLDSLADNLNVNPVTPRVPPNSDVRLKKDGTPDLRYKGH